jgi:hypothetical protein
MKIVITYILFFFCLVTQAQPPKSFYFRFGGNGYDVGNDIKQTYDKGYIITGSTSSFGMGNTDMYLAKLDSMGQKVFDKTFGNYNNEVGKSIIQLSDSNIVMAGYTNSFGFGGYDVFVVKTTKNGNVIWQKTFGGTDWDFAHSIKATQDGGLIVAGTTYSYGRGNADGYILKLDANGNTQWQKTFGGIKDDEFKSVVETNDGGFALTGYTKSYNDIDSGDVWVFKTSNIGDSLWCKFYGGSKEDFGNEIIQHPNGNFFVAGASASLGVGLLDAYFIKMDSNANQIWEQIDGFATTNESANGVTIPKGNPSQSVYAMTDNQGIFGVDPKIMILNNGSGYVNATGYGAEGTEEVFKIISTHDFGFASVGHTNSFNSVLSDIYVIKVDSNLVGAQNITSVNELNSIDKNEVYIYPNPVKDILFIENSKYKGFILMYDIYGKEYKLENFNINNGLIKLDLGYFSQGIYFIEIDSVKYKLLIVK